MAVRINRILEPFAKPTATAGAAKYARPAKSRAAQRLADEMELYALGEIPGRSFLVSGHRGTGKTSAVNFAISEVSRRLADKSVNLRLVDIRLHGPDMFARGTAAEDIALRDTEHMLRQVTLALYRRITDTFADAYSERVATASTIAPSWWHSCGWIWTAPPTLRCYATTGSEQTPCMPEYCTPTTRRGRTVDWTS